MAPREFYTLLEDRLISGLGVIQLPQDGEYRAFRLWTDIVRFPDPDFFNGKWNPERSQYANLSYMVLDYVFKEDIIRYPREVRDIFAKEPASFLAPYLVCSQQSQSNALAAIAIAVGLPPPSPGDPLYAEPVAFSVDEIRFSCRDETAFQLRLYGLKEDIGCPGATPNPKVNIGVPAPLPVVPTDSAIEVSAPYDPPNDNGNTIPYEGDPIPPPPPTYTGIVTSYRGSPNCAVAPDAVTFVWENPTIPVATQLGSPICTDSFKWVFTPNPVGYIFNGVYITPGIAALWNGTSNFDAVDPNPRPITLP